MYNPKHDYKHEQCDIKLGVIFGTPIVAGLHSYPFLLPRNVSIIQQSYKGQERYGQQNGSCSPTC